MDRKTEQSLHDFLQFSDTAARLVARGRTAWDEDEFARLAGEAVMHRIGEAVARLDDAFVAAHPSVSWRPMKRMRDLIAHQYGAVDYDILWNALQRDLPREAAEVRRILRGS